MPVMKKMSGRTVSQPVRLNRGKMIKSVVVCQQRSFNRDENFLFI
jgi:hypothetical protein